MMSGPLSSCSVTKCTVAPCSDSRACEHAPMRVEARVFRQQRGVNVENAAGVARDERRGQNAHESREHDQRGSEFLDRGRERGLVLGTGRGRVGYERSCRDTEIGRGLETPGFAAGRRARRPPDNPSPGRALRSASARMLLPRPEISTTTARPRVRSSNHDSARRPCASRR